HFPGHGDTNVDSHKDLPLITKTYPELDTLELYPFRKLFAAGVMSVMVGHLEIPAIDTTPHRPASLSKPAATQLLREKLGYSGVVITDGMGMQGVAKYYSAVDANLLAFMAGNDIILFPTEVPASIARIKAAMDSGLISQQALETSVRRILGMKYFAGLNKTWVDIDTLNVLRDLNKDINELKEQAAKEAITLVKDDNQIIKKLNDNMKAAYIGINADKTTPLFETLRGTYANLNAQWLPKNGSDKACRNLLAGMEQYDAVVVGVHNISFYPGGNYGLSDEVLNFLQQASQRKNVMIVLMGNAYALQYCCGAPSVIVGYEADSIAEVVAGKMLLKKLPFRGRLPVTVCVEGKSIVPVVKPEKVTLAAGKPQRMAAYDLRPCPLPADAGVVEEAALDRLSMFLNRCVADGIFPGCRVLAAKDGKVFYDQAIGYATYTKETPVDTGMLYDMASCTKMLATNISIMRLYEEGKIALDKTLGDYLPAARGTNKASLTIRDVLLHQAGMKSWIPFYKETLNDRGKPQKNLYHKKKGDGYDIQVADNLYLRNDYRDTIWARIYNSPLENTGKSVYSDLDFILLAAVVQQITGKTIDSYAHSQFYAPLGLKNMTYNPLRSFPKERIAPTELDLNFRQQQVHGYVHDPGAAMMGGVAGHAGLFATAHDVAVIFQMLLNRGVYGGKIYFKPETVALFTAYNSALNHRGLGFDKPATGPDDGGPCGARCSGRTFGHQGFTGTCAWADPATGILFVFLSNRVCPSADNNRINKENVRTLAQDYIYEALGIPVNHDRLQLYQQQVK
ncbi:MAG: serine hydrolase, partial [Chitinophagia bacterium]|nr:serine hydrolase [Chitinophagia bacterium]